MFVLVMKEALLRVFAQAVFCIAIDIQELDKKMQLNKEVNLFEWLRKDFNVA